MKESKAAAGKRTAPATAQPAPRDRVLRAAFTLFHERGFAKTSMLEIATRAHVSKRDLYALFDNKHALLADGIAERAQAMRQPLGAMMPAPATREQLAATLVDVGIAILRTACSAEVLMTYRLAIAESDSAPEVGRVLDKHGREANHRALTDLLTRARQQGLIDAGDDPAALVARYSAVLWADLLPRLLLRVREPPGAREISARARTATEAIMGRSDFANPAPRS
jgi:AcrR family transcriptional regulator